MFCVAVSGCSLYFGGPDHETPPDAHEPPPFDAPETDAGVAPLAMDEPGIYEMAVDATHVYWVENGQFDHEANVRRMPLGGGPIETLFSIQERVYSLAVADGFVYAVHTGPEYEGHVYRFPGEGGSATSIATGFNPTSVSVDGSWVYFSEAVSPGGRIMRVPTTGGEPEVVVDDVDNPWDLVADDGVLFYSEMNRGRMMRVVPGESPVQLASGWIGTGWMVVDDTFVYFTACDVGSCEHPRLFRVARSGGMPEEIVTGAWVESKLAVSGDDIQWGSHVMPKTGGSAHPLDGIDYPLAVAATSTSFYFADFYTGAIYRAHL